MENRLSHRTNSEWLTALRNEDAMSRDAIEDLRAYLHRALRKILRQHEYLNDHDFADFTQDALVKLVEYLPTFRGDSAFTTWATSVATRVAFTELRKRSVREKGQETFERVKEHAAAAPSPEILVFNRNMQQALNDAIQKVLTERQKIPVLAELRGIPTIEIARQLGTNQNALYKLVHDSRKKLRAALTAAGFTSELIHDYAEGGSE